MKLSSSKYSFNGFCEIFIKRKNEKRMGRVIKMALKLKNIFHPRL